MNKDNIKVICIIVSCLVLFCSGCSHNMCKLDNDDEIIESNEVTEGVKKGSKELLEVKNEYFVQTGDKKYKYDAVNFFMEDISDVQLMFNNISSYEDGEVYEITIQADDFPERYDIDNHDRYDIGTFYVTEDKIYALFNYNETIAKDAFISDGIIVCDSNDTDEVIDGYEIKIVNDGETCTFSMWNTLVESGYYCTIVWTKNKGLTSYRSGFGAERDPIELKLTETEE